MTNKMEKIEALINDMFDDTSVPASTTADNLKEIRDIVDNLLECLRADGVDC